MRHRLCGVQLARAASTGSANRLQRPLPGRRATFSTRHGLAWPCPRHRLGDHVLGELWGSNGGINRRPASGRAPRVALLGRSLRADHTRPKCTRLVRRVVNGDRPPGCTNASRASEGHAHSARGEAATKRNLPRLAFRGYGCALTRVDVGAESTALSDHSRLLLLVDPVRHHDGRGLWACDENKALPGLIGLSDLIAAQGARSDARWGEAGVQGVVARQTVASQQRVN
jgi:hypothetical protein